MREQSRVASGLQVAMRRILTKDLSVELPKIVLEPDVARVFPDSAAVNQALHQLIIVMTFLLTLPLLAVSQQNSGQPGVSASRQTSEYERRVFVRSWSLKERSWYRTFREDPRGLNRRQRLQD